MNVLYVLPLMEMGHRQELLGWTKVLVKPARHSSDPPPEHFLPEYRRAGRGLMLTLTESTRRERACASPSLALYGALSS